MRKKRKMQRRNITRYLDAYECYLRENELAGATIRKYMHDLRVFASFSDLYGKQDKAAVLQYKEWLWQRYSVSSCNSMISSLNGYLAWMGLTDLMIKGFRQQKQTILSADSLMTIEEYHKLLRAAKQLGNERLYICMQMIFMTGARVSELRYFTREAVDRGRVIVRNKGKVRVILIPDVLRTLLLSYMEAEGIESGMILVTRRGKPLNRSNLWKEMQQLQRLTDVSPEKLHPHNLRHLFARTYYQATSDVVSLSDILGHSSLNVTRIYTSGTEDSYLEDLNKVTLTALIVE